MLTTLLALVPLLAPVGDQPDPQGASDLVVQVGLHRYRSDGSVSGSAYSTAPPLSSTVYASESLCQMGAGYRELPAMAAYAWKFSGTVQSSSATEAVVQLEWQRVLDRGKAAAGQPATVQLTLRPNDRVLLDSVFPEVKTSECAASVGFEVRYAPRLSLGGTRVGGGSAVGVGSGTAVGGGTGSGVGASARGGSGVGGGTGVGAGPRSGGGGGGFGSGSGSGGSATRTLSSSESSGLLDVELWLVHTAPDRADEVQRQTLRSSPEGAMFAFQPVSIQGTHGAALLQVTGSFAVTRASGRPELVFVTNRKIALATTAPRDMPADLQGGSRSTIAMPGPDEVVSFEMPVLRLVGATIPDRFSVRVRVTPR